METFKVLFVSKNKYEVYNESQPSFSRIFDNRKEAETYCNAANKGKTDEECMEAVRKEQEKRKKRNQAARDKAEVMKSLGLKRVKGNLGGTYWE